MCSGAINCPLFLSVDPRDDPHHYSPYVPPGGGFIAPPNRRGAVTPPLMNWRWLILSIDEFETFPPMEQSHSPSRSRVPPSRLSGEDFPVRQYCSSPLPLLTSAYISSDSVISRNLTSLHEFPQSMRITIGFLRLMRLCPLPGCPYHCPTWIPFACLTARCPSAPHTLEEDSILTHCSINSFAFTEPR